ncbi:MAG: prepilin-type N-terminal cleavage/methylation domain-containing protein, partial [Kiritimatiellae bacterium]|nr:prepilin-type N-terminal cleavage/methylation domain-containing protein [Kiritimatiellia bacterium]
SGMTLIEVLFATVILGVCVFSLFQCLTMNLEAFRKTDFPQGVANVLALADAKYPFVIKSDPVEDLLVDPDSSLLDGWTYERFCDEDAEEEEDEDDIYLVHIIVKQGAGGLGREAEFLKYIYYEEGSTNE